LRRVPITEVCDFQGGTQPPKKEWILKPQDGYIRMLQIRDFTQPDKDNVAYVSTKNNLKTCNSDDILIGRYGASVGKILTGLEGAYNVAIVKSSPDPEKLSKKFLYYILKSDQFQNFVQNVGSRAAQAGFNMGDLEEFNIPLPSLSEQKAIVAKLDRAQRLIDIDREMLAKYDELIQSLFLEMFGDPVRNDKGWEVGSITDYGSLKNGLNYSSKESGTKIRSLGVGDFGVLSKIDNVRAISRIELDKAPPENYLLKDNDLVFVRSNGNKELVGRCLRIYPGNEDVTFSGFCIRYRPNSSSINSTYLSHLFRVKTFRNYMLKDGRGANIQNINQKLLSQLDIPLPDVSKQNQFGKNVEKLEGQILKTQTSLKKSEELFSSLVQVAYG